MLDIPTFGNSTDINVVHFKVSPMNFVDDHWLPSAPPSQECWDERRNKYDQLWMDCIHSDGSTTNQHADGLKWELERCFCSGAWISCVILSAAIIEVHLSHLGAWKKEEALLEKLDCKNDWERLRELRNKLIHGDNKKDPSRLSSQEYRESRVHLREQAEFAVKVALQVTLNNP